MIYTLVTDIAKKFHACSNALRSAKQSSYMRNQFPFLGITTPHRRIVLEPIFKQTVMLDHGQLSALIETLWTKPEREFQYAAIDAAYYWRQLHTPETISLLEQMIRTLSWWDTVDDVAVRLVGPLWLRHHAISTNIDRWITDDNMWIRRSAIICQIRWKASTDIKRLFSYCAASMHEKNFFMRKAIGWALREYSKINPQEVKKFIEAHRSLMSSLSIREGSKYI